MSRNDEIADARTQTPQRSRGTLVGADSLVRPEAQMPTYVMLSTLATEGGRTLHTHPDRLTAVDDEIRIMGCKVISQYALLGQYDFLTIIDAPDAETVAHLSVDLASRGTVHIQTLPAIPLETFVAKLKSHEQLGRGHVEVE